MKVITRISVIGQIVESIKEDIESGRFGVGEKLPAEMILCKMLNVSRSSLREALYQLQADGYVELKAGKGAFVRSASPVDMSETIHKWFASSAPNLKDYMEVRSAISPLAAELACERGSEDEVLQMDSIHKQFIQANETDDIPRLASLDEQFHAHIFKMSHNSLLKKISDLLSRELKQYRVMSISAKEDSLNTVEEHGMIVEAIKERDKKNASKAMLNHIEKAREDIVSAANGNKGGIK